MTKISPIEIRDKREQEWYWGNNEFVDYYSEFFGQHALAIYSVLCRYANNATQECWPSMETITKKAGIKSRKTTSKILDLLEEYNVVSIEKSNDGTGKRANNVYRLNNPRNWKSISGVVVEKRPAVGVTKEVILEKEAKKIIKEIKEEEAINSETHPWLNIPAWNKWVEFRKQIKKKLTPLSIEQQFSLLKKYSKPLQLEIINKSIGSSWQGLFDLKPTKNFFASTTPKAPEGKYSEYSK